MKKMVILVLALVLTLGIAGVASANETLLDETSVLSTTLDSDPSPVPAPPAEQKLPRVVDLPGFEQLVELRAQGHEIHSSICLDKAQVERLSYEAYKEGNREALKAARAFRPTLRNLGQELESLHQTQKDNWEQMNTARQAGDVELMETILNNIIGVREQINGKLSETHSTLQSVIAVLQG